MIPPPHKLGLSRRKFPEWRHHQPAAIRTIGESRTKYTGIVAPTGFGKSLMILGHALHSKERVCILTSTRALQKQYEDDFGPAVLSIMGQANYDCEIALVTVADAPCHGGFKCELRKSGCLPFDLKRAAIDVPVVLTNYQYWLHSMKEKVGLGEFDRVIMDECFTGKTPILTRKGAVPIERISAGDYVYNACGVSQVLSVFTKRVYQTQRTRLSNGTVIESTFDHPIFTVDGWKPVGSLAAGDRLFDHEAVRLLWGAVRSHEKSEVGEVSRAESIQQATMLRAVLCEEIEKPYVFGFGAGKNDSYPAPYWSQAFRTWWQRQGAVIHPNPVGVGAGAGLATGRGNPDSSAAQVGLPHSLQSGFPESQISGRDRTRRIQSSIAESSCPGSEEGRFLAGPWVESVEVIEHRRGISVYNLRVESHPSYFAGGVLVHNCHNVEKELEKFLSTRISAHEADHLSGPPPKNWAPWAALQNLRMADHLKSLKRSKSPDRYKEIASTRILKRKLALLAGADQEGWILSPGYHRGEFNWDCIQPGRYASGLLFKRADKFLLTSASIRPRTFQSLFISPKKVTFKEYPSTFPIKRRPVYIFPAIAYSAHSTREDLEYLIAIMDQFIERRLDRKGLIPSVSYDRAKLIKSMSKFGDRMMTHERDELPAVVKEFKAAGPGTILVSPSIVEGHSFAYRDAEYTIIPKIPFADTRSPIHRARTAIDRTYSMLETCIAVRQMSGRAMRADDDQNETLILDRQFLWLHRMYKRFFPPDFNESLHQLRYLPAPLPSLAAQKIP